MKKLALFLIVILCFTILLVSCGGDTTKDSTNDSTQGSTTNSTPASQQSGGNGGNGGTGGNGGNGGNGSINVENTANTSYGTVTKEEWFKAFDLEGISSLTYTFSDEEEWDGGKDVSNGVVLISNGVEYSQSVSSGYTESFYVKGDVLDTAMNVGSFYNVCSGAINMFEYYDYYGYDEFTYNSQKKCYEYHYDSNEDGYEEIIDIQVYFGSDKLISKIVASWTEKVDGKVEEVENGTAYYMAYNATKEIPAPASEIQATISNTFEKYIADATLYNYSFVQYSDINTAKSDIINILKAIDVSKVTYYYVEGEGYVSLEADIGGSVNIAGSETECKSIRVAKEGTSICVVLDLPNISEETRIDFIQ